MLKRLPILLSALAFITAGLHFLRDGEAGLFAVALVFPFLLLVRREWARKVVCAALWGAALMWMMVLVDIVHARVLLGMPWTSFALIIATIAVLTVLPAIFLGRMQLEVVKKDDSIGDQAAFAAFLITAVLLTVARTRVPFPILLADRFFNGAGWIAIFLLSSYAAWVAARLVESKNTAKLRVRLWVLFAALFFAQLFLGISGVESFLMTGRLHVPVPAVVIAGPLYRGEGFFMPVLFVATVLLAGPAWCSHLCYFGAWDSLAAARRPRSAPMPAWIPAARPAVLAAVVAAALGLRALGVAVFPAVIAAISFGVLGAGIMLFVSRRRGYMAHCTAWCPLGLVAVLAGKLSPFRVRIDSACSECGACTASCRYGALRLEHIRRRAPGLNCTLCGDCIASCRESLIGYRFPGLSSRAARAAFIALVAALHAVFLGIARI